MILDEFTIILGTITLLVAVIAPFFSPFYRAGNFLKQLSSDRSEAEKNVAPDEIETDNLKTTNEELTSEKSTFPINSIPITILITVHDQAKELEEHLPALLSQQYDNEFQIVIVAEQGDSATEDVLKRYANEPNLYSTFIPSSSRYMSRKKLSVTLGVKAAKHEWIIMTDANCQPISPLWLQKMAKGCTQDKQLVMGYSNYTAETAETRQLEQLHTELYLMRKAHKGTAYRTNSANIVFRKSVFIKEEGYRGNLHLLRGEYDFIVNKYAEKQATALVIDKEAWIIEDEPQRKAWINKHLFYLESRKHLKKSTAMRALFSLDMAALNLSYSLITAIGLLSCFTSNYILLATAVVSLITTTILRIRFANRPMSYFLENIALWKVVPFELSIIWRTLSYHLNYRKADKKDFTSHKL